MRTARYMDMAQALKKARAPQSPRPRAAALLVSHRPTSADGCRAAGVAAPPGNTTAAPVVLPIRFTGELPL